MGERKDSLYTNQFTHAHICYPFLKPYLKKSTLSANFYYMTLALLCWVPLIGPVPQIHFIRPLATTPGSIIAFTGPKLPSDPLDIEAVQFTPGNGLCSTTDPSTNQPYASYVRDDRTWIQCRVEAPPGFYNMSVLVVGVGYAWQHSHAYYLGPASELIMFEVFPGKVGVNYIPKTDQHS